MAAWLLVLLISGVQAAAPAPDPVMAAYNRAWALSGQTSTRGQAIERFQAVIETSPRFWRAYQALAQAYGLAGQAAQGEAYFRTLIERDPANAYPSFGLGTLLVEARRYREGADELARCAAKDPRAFICYAALPNAVKLHLKRPASREELRARVPRLFDEPFACVGVIAAQRLSRNMKAAARSREDCVERARTLDDPEFVQYLIRQTSGANRESVRWLRDELRATEARGDAERQFETLSSLGGELAAGGQQEEAEDYVQRALTLARNWGNQLAIANALTNMASFHRLRGDLNEAVRLLLEAMPAVEASGDVQEISMKARDLGLTYRSAGRLDEAMQWLEKALALSRSIRDRSQEAFILRDASLVDADAGDYWKALERIREAERIFHEMGLSWPEGATIGHLPMIYGPLGDYDAALRTARQGLESARANNDPLMEQRIDEHIGSIYLKLGKPEAALPYLRKSISLTPQTEATHLHLNALLSLGEAYAALGQFGKASAKLEEGLAVARRMGRPAAEAQALHLLGDFWLRRAGFDKAKAYFEQSLAISDRIQLAEVSLAVRQGLARVSIATNRPEEAWRQLQPALERMDALRGRIPTPDLRTHFVERNASAYEDAIDALSELHQRQPMRGYDREALAVAERAKARTFLDLLNESKANIRKGLSVEQQRERQGLEWRVSQTLSALGTEDSERNRRAAEEAESKLAEWEESVRLTNPDYSALRFPRPYSPEQARRLAGDRGVAILEFVLGERRSHLWVITGSAVRMVRLPPRARIEAAVNAYRATLARPSNGVAETFSRQLHEMLLGEAEPLLAGTRQLLIAPDGILYYLPFEALTPKPGRYLVEDYTISYAPSISVFASLRTERAGRVYDLLAYGDPAFSPSAAAPVQSVYRSAGIRLSPLPNARTEVREIGALFAPDRRTLRLGEEATEARLKAERLGSYRLIHFATHAVIDERAPARSGIVLSLVNTGTEDGILRASEIVNLNLNADLVTLSACQTGLGKVVRGEGMIGLTRAVLAAGSSRVLVSLWDVSDVATPALMKDFYTRLAAGRSVAGALREAKIAMIHSDRPSRRDPHFWAPFVLSGAF